MKAINKDGYLVSIKLNNLKSNRIPRIFDINNPYTIINIKLYLKKHDIHLKLLSTEYKGIKENLLFQSKEGYLISNNLNNIIQYHTYSPFHINNIYTINNIKQFILNNSLNYKLISNEYCGNDKNLLFECEYGHRFTMSWSSLQQGNRCSICSIEKQKEKLKLPISKAKEIFINAGYEPLFNTYNNEMEKLTGKSKNGYLIYSNINNIKNRKPALFSKSNPYTIHNIRLWLKLNNVNVELLSDKYLGNKKLLKWKCDKNHIFKMSWDHLQTGARCQICYLENHQGKNHPNYNPNKTDEERMTNRYQLYGENIKNWRTQIFIRDQKICQVCHKKERKLNAHHLNGWAWAKDQRFDLENGITLCENCHKLFHSIYGRGKNTREQYEEFKIRYDNHEFIKMIG